MEGRRERVDEGAPEGFRREDWETERNDASEGAGESGADPLEEVSECFRRASVPALVEREAPVVADIVE